MTGDGVGGSEVQVSKRLSGKSCVQACFLQKMADDSINGVTVYHSGRGGCWCERNMKRVKESQTTYKTCLLKPGTHSV